ncbi:MAG: protein kinase [Myxococcota bacterium]|nr:protein kinase [Myxococcota bacterium]
MTVLPTALRKVCPSCGSSYSYDEAHSCTEGNSKLLIDDLPAVDPESLIGATLGDRYHIQGFLEGGGMGAVLRALHVTLLRPVAIKILVLREYEDTAAQQRFFQEAILASRVHHPNVIDIYDFGMLEGGHLYLVMEFLEGRTLRHALREGPLPPWRACLIAAQIARGLQAVHDQGIVHRDLKPDNVFLLQRDGHADFVKIVDFGIAKARGGPNLTRSGMLVGTPLYMAPEQITGGVVDPRVDQYSLGCVLYRMLTATLPFDSPDTGELLSMHVHAPVPPLRERRPDLAIPASLEAVVLRLMAKRAEDRFSSMLEVAETLACEMERLGERHDSPRPQSGSGPRSTGVLPIVLGPRSTGALPAVAGPPAGGAAAAEGGGVVAGGMAAGGQTRLLSAPVVWSSGRPARRGLLVPAALGVGAGGVVLFLMAALGNRPPQAMAIHSERAPVPSMPSMRSVGREPVQPGIPGPSEAVPPRAEAPGAALAAHDLAPGAALVAHDLAPAADLAQESAQLQSVLAASSPQPRVLPRPADQPPARAPLGSAGLLRPRPAELTVRFEVKHPNLPVLVHCGHQPAVRCEGSCVVPLPEGPGECVVSAPGSGFRPESFPLSALRALPRQGGVPRQPVELRYIRP